jgi:hypothetical protein
VLVAPTRSRSESGRQPQGLPSSGRKCQKDGTVRIGDQNNHKLVSTRPVKVILQLYVVFTNKFL